ncbi:MAG: hypothetical protein DDT30_00608 [Dehalococcoidia bacterium]|nr:hypothetical protein [Bacillota bacterium]MBT9142036.1 hypothetical protein [Bacillota bacterium]
MIVPVKPEVLCDFKGTFTNLHAALQVARKLGVGKRVAVVVPGTGERYLTTEFLKH